MAQTMNQEEGNDLMTVLNLTPRDTSTALALFYVAYVIFDFPSNLIMTRVSPRAWMARIVMATGLVGACFAAAQAAWSLKYDDAIPSLETHLANPISDFSGSCSVSSSLACGPACPTT